MKIQLVFDEQKRGDFDVNGPAEIYKALRAQNIRSEVLLFDRCIDMCFERKFDDAEILAQSLLLLHPRDKQANILLIKILSAQKKYTQARQEIQKAKSRGSQIPSNVRMYVEEGIKREEIKKRNEIVQLLNKEKQKEEDLRNEIKKLRRERELLQNESSFLAEQTKKWYLIASCIAGFGLFIIIALPYFLNQTSEEEKPNEQTQTELDERIQLQNEVDRLKKELSSKSKVVQNDATREKQAMSTNPDSDEINTPNPTTSQEHDNVVSTPKKTPSKQPITSTPTISNPRVNSSEKKSDREVVRKKDPNPSSQNTDYPFTYIVQKGDTLDKIAERYYGKKSQWKIIAENNDVTPRNLQIGQKLEIVAP